MNVKMTVLDERVGSIVVVELKLPVAASGHGQVVTPGSQVERVEFVREDELLSVFVEDSLLWLWLWLWVWVRVRVRIASDRVRVLCGGGCRSLGSCCFCGRLCRLRFSWGRSGGRARWVGSEAAETTLDALTAGVAASADFRTRRIKEYAQVADRLALLRKRE